MHKISSEALEVSQQRQEPVGVQGADGGVVLPPVDDFILGHTTAYFLLKYVTEKQIENKLTCVV